MSIGFEAIARFIGNYAIKVGGVAIVGALNEGRGLGVTEYEPTGVQYSAILDSRVCEYCESLDGLVIDLREPNGLDLFDKYQPQQHVSCRCMWIYFQDSSFNNDNKTFEQKWQENFKKIIPDADLSTAEIVKQFASLNYENKKNLWRDEIGDEVWEEARLKLRQKAEVKEKQFISGLEKWFRATAEEAK